MFSVHSGDVCVVKYFLDHGGDPTKADAKGRSVLHYAVCTGSSANHTLIKCCITKYFMKVFSIKNLLMLVFKYIMYSNCISFWRNITDQSLIKLLLYNMHMLLLQLGQINGSNYVPCLFCWI